MASRRQRSSSKGHESSPPRSWWAAVPTPAALLLLTIAAVGVDVARIGFFADDFHFLDVARRIPLLHMLSGQHGMWPWYRPLSRELYFEAAVAAGPASLAVAHGVSLSCLFGCAFLLWRIGRNLLGGAAGAVGAALFLTAHSTKFLTAWASGFQDLLSLFLTLLSLDSWLRKRSTLAIVAATLATFAKEPGVIAFPLLLACAVLVGNERPSRAWITRLISAFALSAAVHAVVRLTWRTAGGAPRTALEPERLPAILGQMFEEFVKAGPGPGEWSAMLAVLAALGALLLLIPAHSPAQPSAPIASPRRAAAFLGVAAALGLAPVIAAHLLSLTYAHAYQTFPALPWTALLIAQGVTRLPSVAWRAGVPLYVAWHVWTLGFAPPNLEQHATWQFRRWDWHEAVRFTAISARLRDDVREQLADRPESLVVLYTRMPAGSFFQTEDGPATREALGDRTVRAYWVNDPPAVVRGDRLAILAFDPDRFHLERADASDAAALRSAIDAIMAREARVANVFAHYGESSGSARFDRAYLRAAAALLEEGPAGFARGLARAGLVDTLGSTPRAMAEPFAAIDPALARALAATLRHPLSATAHLTLAESLLVRGVLPRAGLELRIAVTLDPARHEARLRLAQLMIELGGDEEALVELREIVRDATARPTAQRARELLESLAHNDSLARRMWPDSRNPAGGR